jgi:hypothetical protein
MFYYYLKVAIRSQMNKNSEETLPKNSNQTKQFKKQITLDTQYNVLEMDQSELSVTDGTIEQFNSCRIRRSREMENLNEQPTDLDSTSKTNLKRTDEVENLSELTFGN